MSTEITTPSIAPGFHYAPSFPGGEPYIRPQLEYLCAMLEKFWGMRRVGSTNCGSPIVEDATYPSGGDWWVISDNGGEINLHRINAPSPEITQSVPYVQFRGPVTIGRLAWFCRCVLKREPIEDYLKTPADAFTLADLD